MRVQVAFSFMGSEPDLAHPVLRDISAVRKRFVSGTKILQRGIGKVSLVYLTGWVLDGTRSGHYFPIAPTLLMDSVNREGGRIGEYHCRRAPNSRHSIPAT